MTRLNGIQNVVLTLIQHKKSIERKELLIKMSELCKTNGKKLTAQVDQALYCLKKKGYITNNNGIWKTLHGCEVCHISFVCGAITAKNGHSYCPIRNMYIANPKLQCGVLFGFDTDTMMQTIIPKRECYFPYKPTELEIEYMKKCIEEREK